MSTISSVSAAQMAAAQNAAAQNTTQSTGSAQSGLSAKTLEKIRQSAIEFEGVTIGEMLQPMFDTVDTSNGLFGGGAAEAQFRSMQVLELGKQIANNGGIGLADSVYRQMLAMQETAQQEKTQQKKADHDQ
ncbi:rod-binding protein [Acetobacter okinawensis]|uniref:rod-binding protein n=1 Tax=Acetobacter okinawensis TaxID=1076594 RepID=UPI00214DCA1B|nr:rod-binding protein [Acetobacter okinawensis]